MKISFAMLILGLVVGVPNAFATPWSLISVKRDPINLEILGELPVLVEGGTQDFLHVEARPLELATLRLFGVDFEVIEENLQALRPPLVSQGIPWLAPTFESYHDEVQIESSLRELAAAFPQITRLMKIGVSVEGRPIWGVLLSDNPWTRELDEPSLRMIGGHHGNEWASTEVTLASAWHFAINYESSTSIKSLLDSTELWIIPALNPDGMNAFTRNNANNIDLNRNYAFAWRDRTYSGPAPFSEPETAVIRNWSMARVFYHSLSTHSGAANIGWVWNSTTERCPDDAWMEAVSARYLAKTTYPDFWITNGADWYVVYGDTNDWSYGKRGGHDYTLELSENKTPPEFQLSELVQHHLPAIEGFFSDDGLQGVRGRVVDGWGRGVEAIITVEDGGSRTFSDFETGTFHRLLEPGSYVLRFEAVGFEVGYVEVDVSEDGASYLVVNLESSNRLEDFTVIGREQHTLTPGPIRICGIEAEELHWALYRSSVGLIQMGSLYDEGDCWLGNWTPANLSNVWEREGEWTLLLTSADSQVLGRSSSGVLVAPKLTLDWDISLEAVEEVPDGISVESASLLTRLVLDGEDIPDGGVLRLVSSKGQRVIPLFQEKHAGGSYSWLINTEAMEEGTWSIRFLGAGHWNSFPQIFRMSNGLLEMNYLSRLPEIDLEMDFPITSVQLEERDEMNEQGCDCAHAPRGEIYMLLLLGLLLRERKRLIR